MIIWWFSLVCQIFGVMHAVDRCERKPSPGENKKDDIIMSFYGKTLFR